MSLIHDEYKRNGQSTYNYIWAEVPNECPMCHTIIEPVKKSSHYIEDTNVFYIIYFCNACKRVFIAKHNEISSNKLFPSKYELFPKFYIPKKFDDKIEKMFPDFCRIYNESLHAENEQLNDIAGPGFRKALEFLIKDYCIYSNQQEEEKIKKMQLANVIENYIDKGSRLQAAAKASTWLGNDETHYIKKWENKDINDLKKFIETTVSFINYNLLSDEAIDMINSGDPNES